MSQTDENKTKTTATYNAASDTYDDPANFFWARFGLKTIERLNLQAGEHILDVCCGSGASAIPASQKVGASGSVFGIDLSEKLLSLARIKAKEHNLQNVEFRVGDMLKLGLLQKFDAVVCVFGIFFVEDMAQAVHALWQCVRPTGKLAITTWGPRFFEPATTAFWNTIRDVRPELYKGFNPWDRITDPTAVMTLLNEGRVEQADVVAESGSHPIPSPEAWWSAVLGSGYRGTLEQLNAKELEYVRTANMEYIQRSGITSIEANVVYAVAIKPSAI